MWHSRPHHPRARQRIKTSSEDDGSWDDDDDEKMALFVKRFGKFMVKKGLPSRFDTLVTILVRSGLDTMTPNQVLRDIMTDDTYRDDDEKEEKMEKKDEKKKSVAFKATSSKGKAKQDISSEDEGSFFDMMMMMRRWLSL